MVMFKKKQVVLAVIMGMVLVAGYINWAYQTEELEDTQVAVEREEDGNLGEAELVNAKVETDAIKRAKQERDTARDKAIEGLNKIVNNPSSSEDGKKQAEQKLSELSARIEKEGVGEAALGLKGMKNAVVIISDTGVMVTVKTKDELTEKQVTVIKDAIVSSTGLPAENIKISRIKE